MPTTIVYFDKDKSLIEKIINKTWPIIPNKFTINIWHNTRI